MIHHTPEQEKAWRAVGVLLDSWAAADAAVRRADRLDQDEAYPALLRECLRLERELDGAWMHYHSF